MAGMDCSLNGTPYKVFACIVMNEMQFCEVLTIVLETDFSYT